MKCEKCRTEMKYYVEGSTQINKCPKCGWSFATTYIDPIHEDNTVYSLIIEQGNDINAKTIMELKKHVNLTNSEIINILKTGNYVIAKQKAIEIKNSMEIFNNLNIKFRIEPHFKWQ